MTTPAINTNESVNVRLHTTVSDGSDFFTDKKGMTIGQLRPASVSTTKGSDGRYHEVTSYYRKGFRITQSIDGFIRVTRPSVWPGWWANFLGYLGDFSYFDGFADGAPSWMYDVSHAKALLALKGQKVNLGVAFAERHETAELFSGAAEHVAQNVKDFRRVSPKDWAAVTSAKAKNGFFKFPSSYLQMVYGWQPLMSDVSGACTALSNRERSNQAYTATVKGNCKEQKLWDYGAFQLVPGADLVQLLIKLLQKVEVRTTLNYVLDNPVLATFSSLGLTNPAEIVWERVPYSFVVDWFLPVGNWLSTLDADFGWKFQSGCDTEFGRWTEQVDLNETPFGGFVLESVSLNPKAFYARYWTFYRSRLTGTPGVGIPHFKNPFSSKHIANATALLTEAFRR